LSVKYLIIAIILGRPSTCVRVGSIDLRSRGSAIPQRRTLWAVALHLSGRAAVHIIQASFARTPLTIELDVPLHAPVEVTTLDLVC
jgi:hypothetical protein